MLQAPPAEPGMREEDVETPALLLDLDAFEHNLDTMAAMLAPTGAKLRAHAKTHTPRKLARLAALSSIARVAVCADSEAGIAAIEAAAAAAGLRMTVLVEIDCGAGRCGVAPGPEAVALAERIAGSRHLVFGGLQSYHGSAQHRRTPEARAEAIGAAAEETRRTVEQLRQRGLACAIVGGAGTGSFAHELASGVWNEIQAGSYAFMDADYARNEDPPPFRQSLFVLSQVMSAPKPGVAVLDAGHKAVAVDSGLPLVHGLPGVTYAGASDEHGSLKAEDPSLLPKLGQSVRLVPGHCDPTVDRYDWYVGVRKGRVECLWPVAARGGMA
ncbi:MAG: alanine racemase [Sphingomonadales bacterium 12-62-5]|nr:MAG: alanine racemase [Sphingomonadales bacterium 12-62-5]